MPESIPAPLIIDTRKDTFREARASLAAEGVRPRHDHLGWILSVPDTHQKSVLAALDKERTLRVLTCSTEDEANAIAAGLWMGGEPFALMIQHAGLYASVNTLRGVAMDGRVPIFYMIGLLQREKDKDPRESRHSMVRYCEPLLDLFGVPHARLEGPDDVRFIPEYYRLAQKRRGPAAAVSTSCRWPRAPAIARRTPSPTSPSSSVGCLPCCARKAPSWSSCTRASRTRRR